MRLYANYFYSLISILFIALFDVHTKLNNHILQCSDLKCTYKIEPSQIDCHIPHYSKVFFSKVKSKVLIIFVLQSHSMIKLNK